MSILGFSLAAIGLSSNAFAVDPIDIGSLKNKNIRVVQKMLYQKSGMTEIGALAGIMPFDAFTVTPKIDLSYGKHMTERSAWEVVWGLGYGLKNGDYKELEGPSYGITPDAYRYWPQFLQLSNRSNHAKSQNEVVSFIMTPADLLVLASVRFVV